MSRFNDVLYRVLIPCLTGNSNKTHVILFKSQEAAKETYNSFVENHNKWEFGEPFVFKISKLIVHVGDHTIKFKGMDAPDEYKGMEIYSVIFDES